MPDKQSDFHPTFSKRAKDAVEATKKRRWAEAMHDTHTDLQDKMRLVALDMRVLKDAEEALFSRAKLAEGEQKERLLRQLEKWESWRFFSLVKEVADQTGADPAQIIDKNTRTPEQEQALIEAANRRELARIDAFANSNYMIVLGWLQGTKSLFDPDPAHPDLFPDLLIGDEDPDPWSFKESFLWYYFTTRPDIRPSAQEGITEADKEAVIALYNRFEAFLVDYFGSIEKAEHCKDPEYIRAIEAFIARENPDDAQEIIERLTSVLPEKYVIPNNKLANTLTRGIIDIGDFVLEESRRGARKLVETTCALTYEGDNVHLSGRQPFTEYDRNVYNAVSSLYVYGDKSHVVTPAMVYRAMTGLTETEKPTAGQLAAVTRSLDKMRFIRARIDCTEELKARHITLNSKQINGGEIDTYLLTAEAIKVQAGGQTVKAYRIIKTPILYEYAAAVRQVLTIPASVLDVKAVSEITVDGAKKQTIGARLPNTETRILIKGYLIRRIEGMKGKNSLHNPVIALYDYERDGETHQGLYSIAGNADPTRTEANRIRDDAEKILAYWQAIGYIKAFEAQTERKKITGYKITV